jgi:pimeloyl-ACP methyl ester carboxylesterase
VSVVEAAAFLRDNLRCDNYFELMDSFLSTEHHLGDIDCPVLIAWSEDDTLIPQDPYGVRFPALVPHADVVTLPSVGHVPMYDDAGLVARTVLDYTATVDAADIVVPAAG